MTAPSTEQQVAEARAALQKRFTQMLLSSKDKTHKIEKLLAKSPEFQQLLSASAADVIKQATALGHSDNANTRFAATKIAETEAKKVMEELRSGLSEELAAMIEDELTKIEFSRKGVRDALHKCTSAQQAFKTINGYEFMKNPLSKDLYKLKWNGKELASLAESMDKRNGELDEQVAKLKKVKELGDEAKMREAVRKYRKENQELQNTITYTTRKVSDLLKGLSVDISEKAIEAFVTQVKKKGDLKELDEAFEFADKIIEIICIPFAASEATGTIRRAALLISQASKRIGHEIIVKEGKKEERATSTDADIRAQHGKNPLMMATTMYEKQTAAVGLLLDGIGTTLSGALIAAHGAGEVVMKLWDPVAKGIKDFLESRFKARLAEAKKLLDAKQLEKLRTVQSDEDGSFKKELEKKIKEEVFGFCAKLGEEAVKELSKAGEEGPGQKLLAALTKSPQELPAAILGVVLKPLFDQIMVIFPPKPAELIDDAELAKMTVAIHIAKLPLDMVVRGDFSRTELAHDFTSLDVKPADIDQSAWDQFDEVNAGRTSFPNDPTKRTYWVQVRAKDFGDVKVWGEFNPRTKMFTPQQLDELEFDDWSNREAGGRGYSEGRMTDPPTVQGRWSIVTVGSEANRREYITLVESSGKRHWGGGGDALRVRGETLSTVIGQNDRLTNKIRETMGPFRIGQ
jgi:nucleotidyltransferase/DNA polymerase involved in DNA repair